MRSLLFFLVLGLTAACGSSSAPATTTTTPSAPADDHCPMTAGTSVAVEDTATGAAMVFTTTGDRAALRRLIDDWADGHNRTHAAMGPMPTGDEPAAGHDHGGGHDHGAHGGGHDPAAHGGGHDHGGADRPAMIGTHSRVEVADTAQGVRVTFVTFPDQVGAIQAELRAHAEHLSTHGCAPPEAR